MIRLMDLPALLVLTSLLLILGACGDDMSQTSMHTLVVDGQEREFIVYVPAQVRDMDRAPVVFMFHGTGGDGEKFYAISQWREKADAENFIAVFPSALVHCYLEDRNRDGDFTDAGELRVTSKWANGGPGSPRLPLCSPAELAMLTAEQLALADHPLADDVLFVQEMLDFIGANYNADQKRIYASGFSNGGGMTSRLAVELPERFAAVAAAAGLLSISPHAVVPRSFVFSVGSLDTKFTQQPGIASIPLDDTLFLDLPEFKTLTVDPMLTVLQLGESHTHQVLDIAGKVTSHFTFSETLASADNSYTMIVIEDLGHAYPNGTNHPVVLADYLWDFFKDKTLP